MGQVKTVYLDLDRTIFRTKNIDWIWQAICGRIPKMATKSISYDEIGSYYVSNSAGSYYDFIQHINSYGLSLTEVQSAVDAEGLGDGRFQYPGVSEVINTIIDLGLNCKVLTYGEDVFQRFKAGLCPSLVDIEIITMLSSKSDYFENRPEGAILLDDKPIGRELPANVMFFQAINYNGLNDDNNYSWQKVQSLAEFVDIVNKIIKSQD